MEKVSTLQLVENQVEMPQREAEAHGDPTKEQTPIKICDPWKGAHTGTGLLAGLWPHGEPMLKQSVPEGLYPPMERTHDGAVLEDLQPVG